MEILLITPYIPYPHSEGGKISQFAVVDYLRRSHKITMALVATSPEDLENIAILKTLIPNVDIQTIDLVVAQPKATSVLNSVSRLKKKIMRLLKGGGQGSGTANEFDNSLLNNIPYAKDRGLINALNKVVTSKPFDLVQIDLIEFVDLVYMLPAHVKKVFVHHEIRFGRLESVVPANKQDDFEKYISKFVQRSEVNYLNQYDAVIVFSEDDKRKLETQPGLANKVFTSPFPVLDKNFVPIKAENKPVDKLVFIGGDGHSPNHEAVKWYIDEIAPLIAKFSNIKLHVIGKWSANTISAIDPNGVAQFAGFVDDIIEYCDNSVMLVPVRTGSGIRTKILYSMAQGVPVISASIGCEGILVKDKESILVANSPLEFAQSVELLLNDHELRYKLAIAAQKVAKDIYSQSAAGGLRSELYQSIVSSN